MLRVVRVIGLLTVYPSYRARGIFVLEEFRNQRKSKKKQLETSLVSEIGPLQASNKYQATHKQKDLLTTESRTRPKAPEALHHFEF